MDDFYSLAAEIISWLFALVLLVLVLALLVNAVFDLGWLGEWRYYFVN